MADCENHVRNAEHSRSALLEAATRVFAKRGFAGTSMREIAEEAGLKKPLLYHYFGSKEGLYSAVKRSIVGRLPQRVPTTARTVDDASDDLPREVRQLFDTIHEHEQLFRISAWAYLEGDSGLWPEVIEFVMDLRRRVDEAQKREPLRWNIDLETLSVMLLGVVSFGPQIRSRIANDRGRGPALVRQLIALTVEGRDSQA